MAIDAAGTAQADGNWLRRAGSCPSDSATRIAAPSAYCEATPTRMMARIDKPQKSEPVVCVIGMPVYSSWPPDAKIASAKTIAAATMLTSSPRPYAGGCTLPRTVPPVVAGSWRGSLRSPASFDPAM